MEFEEFEFWDRRFQSLSYHMNQRFDALEALIKNQTEEIKKMSESQSDLDTSLTALVADVTNLTTTVAANSAAIQVLLAKIAAGASPADLSAEVAQVQSTDQAVKDAISAITTADTSAS